eukprot:TRINITY_DN4625_c0_g1_i1.p1 TRINITY_DN4625_c0_g1~~TRINITY_DN4625_c0_g1_i1.p1  ORF type:complete len:350 (-),score=51.84 TRINITY_DN4625_c0_g1_i1:78-1127(-)
MEARIRRYLDELEYLRPFIGEDEYHLRKRVLNCELEKYIIQEDRTLVVGIDLKAKHYQYSDDIFLSIMMPREEWGIIQRIRTHYAHYCHTGPGFILTKSFFQESFLSDVKEGLSQCLRSCKPFDITFSRIECVYKKRISYLMLLPEDTDQLDMLLNKLKSVTGENLYEENPFYISLGSFRSKTKMRELKERLESIWEPITFRVSELSVIKRQKAYGPTYKFLDVSLPLGSKKRSARVGPQGTQPGSPASKSLVIYNLPELPSERETLQYCSETLEIYPLKTETIIEPTGKHRETILEFSSEQSSLESLQRIQTNLQKSNPDNLSIERLSSMTYPDRINGTTRFSEHTKF